ncbi:hypothetical protein MTO96_039598 [Rhipicephalus appendiculatus]
MAAAEAMAAASKKPSMASMPGAAPGKAAVPVGAEPVVPAYVPPARQYDDEDDDDADDPGKAQQRPMMNPTDAQGPSTAFIFSVALVVLTLAAVATFYAFDAIRNAEADPPSAATTASPEAGNDTAQNAEALDVAEPEGSSVADLEGELETIPPVGTT